MIGPDDFRRVLGHFATGVTILTTADPDGRPTGLTASAFCSVSLDPPLVLICVDHKSQSFPALSESRGFAVNVLSAAQEDLSRRFASTRLDKFDGVAYTPGLHGAPVLHDALAQIECETVGKHVQGDHTIFVGRVERARVGSGEPLVYFRGRYERLASVEPGATS